MASSNLSNLHNNIFLQTLKTTHSSSSLTNLSISLPRHHRRRSTTPVVLSLSATSSSSPPPTSKEDAILQASSCLSTTLQKPLSNPKLSISKLKKPKQPKYRVEIPIVDDDSTQLAVQIFGALPVKKKSEPVRFLIIWPNIALSNSAASILHQSADRIEHVDILSVDSRGLIAADVVVFFTPESKQLRLMKTVTDSLYPKPVVMVNPRWGFEEEEGFGESKSFVGSFEVIYSFMGLEVKGILSKRKGMVFKCVRDGVLSGAKWNVLVEEEEEEGGDMKVVTSFKSRPSIGEVEMVLYNLMAMNSPITKSAKFLKNLLSSVTGKK